MSLMACRRGARSPRARGSKGMRQGITGERVWTSVWADPMLRACAGVALGGVVWFLVVVVEPVGPLLAGWLLTPLSVVLAGLGCRRASAGIGQGAASRFWRRVAAALAVFSLSMVS